MKTQIVVRTQCEGFHKWVGAPEEVKFLRNLHRHVFHIELKISVTDDDRELEFFMVKRKLDEAARYVLGDVGRELSQDKWSCEQIANCIINTFQGIYGKKRQYECSVFEDGENGAIVCTE